jgi:uncharacterized protein with PQ loop repeat
MAQDSVFSLANMTLSQGVAFFSFAIFTIGFFAWVAYLVRKK